MKQESSDLVHCKNCNSQILSSIWEIHDARCLAFQTSKKNKPGSIKRVSIFRTSKLTKIEQKIAKQNQNQKKQLEDSQEMIPCLECGQNIPFSIYAIHQGQCIEHQLYQCQKCKVEMPEYLINQHNEVCESKQTYPIQEYHNDSDSEEEGDYEGNLHYSRLISNLAIREQKKQKQGLTKKQIQRLPKVFLRNEDDCSICYTKLKKTERHVQLPCKHNFHRICINPWLQVNPLCPICRKHPLNK